MAKEFNKEKPPTFDIKVKKVEEAEAWLLRMKKYFKVHDYSNNMKERVAIFNLKGKVDIWWEDLRNVKDISEELSWRRFVRYFREKYPSEEYYDSKVKFT